MRPALAALPGTISALPRVLLNSVTNAFGEEVICRLARLASVADLVPREQALPMSGACFGLAHYDGIPSGVLGVLMAGTLGRLAEPGSTPRGWHGPS